MKQRKNSRNHNNPHLLSYLKTFILILIVFFLHTQYTFSKEKWFNVYFTSPGNDPVDTIINPEKNLVFKIQNTKKSIFGSFYEITSKPVIDELINAKNRGIDVKLVLEKDNFFDEETQRLAKSGIEIITDDRSGLMHNKFAVFDNQYLWTGSYNITHNGAYKNNNNAVFIQSSELARIYMLEFNEMFKEKIFGNKTQLSVLAVFQNSNSCCVNGNRIDVYFSPEDKVENKVIEILKNTKATVNFMTFSFTSDKIGEKLIQLHRNGIKIRGIFEKIGANSKYSEFKKLKIEGIPVITDKNKYRMHHKVIIIDNNIVITGSYNLSKNADKNNDENMIVIYNKEIANLYTEEFNRLMQGASNN